MWATVLPNIPFLVISSKRASILRWKTCVTISGRSFQVCPWSRATQISSHWGLEVAVIKRSGLGPKAAAMAYESWQNWNMLHGYQCGLKADEVLANITEMIPSMGSIHNPIELGNTKLSLV